MKRTNWEHPKSQVTLKRPFVDVITKFSQLDGLPIFLTNSASMERFARWTSAIKEDSPFYHRRWFKTMIKSFLFQFLLSPIATDKIKGGKILLKGLGNVITKYALIPQYSCRLPLSFLLDLGLMLKEKKGKNVRLIWTWPPERAQITWQESQFEERSKADAKFGRRGLPSRQAWWLDEKISFSTNEKQNQSQNQNQPHLVLMIFPCFE